MIFIVLFFISDFVFLKKIINVIFVHVSVMRPEAKNTNRRLRSEL